MLFFSLFLVQFNLWASPPRISSENFDLSTTKTVYLKPGLISILQFPINITEVKVGNPGSLKALLSPTNTKELTLFFKNSRSVPTNLIIRAEKRIFVFDIIPSNQFHQDYIKIQASFNFPSQNNSTTLIDSSSTKAAHPTKLQLLEKSEL